MYPKSYPKIVNIQLTNAGQEYNYTLPDQTKAILIKTRSAGYDLQLAYIANKSGSEYMTIPAGSPGKWIEGTWLNGLTLYFQTAQAGEIVELEIWT